MKLPFNWVGVHRWGPPAVVGGATVEPGATVVGAAEVAGAVVASGTVEALECFEAEELHAPMRSVAATAAAAVRAVLYTRTNLSGGIRSYAEEPVSSEP